MSDRIPNVVVIPTRDRLDLLVPLVESLLAQPELDKILVLDNSDDCSNLKPLAAALEPDDLRVHGRGTKGWSIYEMWNYGWRQAPSIVPGLPPRKANVFILNDDIEVTPDFVAVMAEALRAEPDRFLVCPDYNRRVAQGSEPGNVRPILGTYREFGMCGWAFALRAELLNNPLPPIDEQFEWWCGDDDLAAQIAKAGGTMGLIEGLPVDHHHEATARLHDWTHAAKARDLQRFAEKYGPR